MGNGLSLLLARVINSSINYISCHLSYRVDLDFFTGFVLIWGPPVILGLEDPPDPTKNIREFTRSFKLCEDGITVFTILKE